MQMQPHQSVPRVLDSVVSYAAMVRPPMVTDWFTHKLFFLCRRGTCQSERYWWQGWMLNQRWVWFYWLSSKPKQPLITVEVVGATLAVEEMAQR
jgi:hypothetical protein